MPLISVIIPTCNGRARFVDQALASVAAQTFQDFELIIVDDASTDGTLEYIQDLMPKIMSGQTGHAHRLCSKRNQRRRTRGPKRWGQPRQRRIAGLPGPG